MIDAAPLARITDTPATITQGPEGAIDPRALMRKPVRACTGDNKYPSLQRAMDLAAALDVTPTYERIRLLE